jgi:1-phosphofructokinase/tagatose 6-phosphate kinase
MSATQTAADAFLCVCLNPVIQKTLVFERLEKGEVNRSPEHRVDASGKGVNVARVLTQTGRRAIHLTQAGGPTRDWFLSLCARDGIELRTVDSGSEIRSCYTVIDRSDHAVTELVEEALPVSPGTGDRLREAFAACLGETRAVVISGTKAAGIGDEVIPAMAEAAAEAGKLLVLDIKGSDLLAALPFRPRVVKPNLAELLATWPAATNNYSGTGKTYTADSAAALRAHVEALAADLFARYGTSLVVTRGPLPVWYWEEGRLLEEAFPPRRALNPTGSGDAFTAGLTAILAEGGSLRDAVREGNRLGGLNAESLKPGSIA